MKKIFMLLVALIVLVAGVTSASAVDVKFSGSYYVEGLYRSNSSQLDKSDPANTALTYNAGSKALYFQRLRVQTDFQVVEGLKLVTRFDALEKRWGDQTWPASTAISPYDVTSRLSNGSANSKVQENFEFERVYVDFNTAVGRFLVGYQPNGKFGTEFYDTNFSNPGFTYILPNMGPVTLQASYFKIKEQEVTAAGSGRYADLDRDQYLLSAIIKGKAAEGGLQLEYTRDASGRQGTATLVPAAGYSTATYATNPAYTSDLYFVNPYFKTRYKSLFFETEGLYGFGKFISVNNPVANGTDVTLGAYGFYAHARFDINMFYGGLMFVMMSGDDPSTPDKVEGGFASLNAFQRGQDFQPTLIMKNDPTYTYSGGITGALGSAARGGTSSLAGISGTTNATNQFMDNIWFYQLYFGVKPTPKLDIVAKVSYAYADKKPWQTPAVLGITGSQGDSSTEFNSNKYGTEVDLVATYKIYDNLEYQVGVGYYWVGDYYKGYYTAANEPKLENDYALMHKLTLTF